MITRSKRLRTWGSKILLSRPRMIAKTSKKYPRLVFSEIEMVWIKEALRACLPPEQRRMDEEYSASTQARHQSMLERVKRLEARRQAKNILRLAQQDGITASNSKTTMMEPETSGRKGQNRSKSPSEAVSIGQLRAPVMSPRKRKTKAEREEENYQFIKSYRTKMLVVANKEANKMRKSLKLEKGESKYSKISFNETKEILEFSSSIYPQKQKFCDLIESESDPHVQSSQGLYSIKSALKGSQEVLTGELSSRFSILGQKRTVNVIVPEFASSNSSTPSKGTKPR